MKLETTPAELDKLNIIQTFHDKLPLIILNYHQIDTPKLDPLARLCRSIVVDHDYNVVAQGFRRFFNLGEVDDPFDWSNFKIYEKIDGSYIKMYYHQGWQVNTRKTFGNMPITELGPTWRDVVFRNINLDSLHKTQTYIFELVGPLNKVITPYPEGLYLTAGRENGHELSDRILDSLSCSMGVKRPQVYDMTKDELIEWIAKQEFDNPTFEGVVVKDVNNNRYKLKNKGWYALSQIKGNGNLGTKSGFIKSYLAGNADEAVALFPEYKESFDSFLRQIDDLVRLVETDYNSYKHLSQKEFALAIADRPYKHALFSKRKGLPYITERVLDWWII